MSEYIIEMGNSSYRSTSGLLCADVSQLKEEVVRCRDCRYYYEAENYHPYLISLMKCCKYFDSYNDEVNPDGFCAWGERREQ